jgi:hypothetical protein
VIVFLEKAVPLTHEIDILVDQLPEELIVDFPNGINELTLYATIKRYMDGDELIEKKDIMISINNGQFFLDWARKIIFR